MPDETAAQTPASDLLGDLDISDPLSGSGAIDDSDIVGDSDGDAQPDSGDQNIVYDDVDKDQYFTIDTETGDKDVLDPSQVPDSAQIEMVDDNQDDSFEDGLVLDDSSITPAVDLSPSDSFEFEDEDA